jgi:hypothetical protein
MSDQKTSSGRFCAKNARPVAGPGLGGVSPPAPPVQRSAAVTMISTVYSGAASFASPVARAGV